MTVKRDLPVWIMESAPLDRRIDVNGLEFAEIFRPAVVANGKLRSEIPSYVFNMAERIRLRSGTRLGVILRTRPGSVLSRKGETLHRPPCHRLPPGKCACGEDDPAMASSSGWLPFFCWNLRNPIPGIDGSLASRTRLAMATSTTR